MASSPDTTAGRSVAIINRPSSSAPTRGGDRDIGREDRDVGREDRDIGREDRDIEREDRDVEHAGTDGGSPGERETRASSAVHGEPEAPPASALHGEDFETFFARHHHEVVRALALALPDSARAEDVAQEAFALRVLPLAPRRRHGPAGGLGLRRRAETWPVASSAGRRPDPTPSGRVETPDGRSLRLIRPARW